MISEQDTMPGQASSRAVLARTTRSNASPGSERLMSLSLSALLNWLELMRTEASHPLTMQSWKNRRRVAAAVVGVAICFGVMSSVSVDLEDASDAERRMRKSTGKAMVGAREREGRDLGRDPLPLRNARSWAGG
ncbi:hypothetical protein RJ639_037624 [Escallonia herrerae]|uniref:Transmembrane protein n=1 Tax=Escallonia herrerae TaxID=1293975 RepID=A0AA89BFH0_9ASTE|nr:hypothetical protein RJ639_037624 [Escallonia herrerae]